MKLKAMCFLAVSVAVAAMLGYIMPLYASESDDKIQSMFVNTYVYKTYLRDDAIRTVVKDGVVTLTGAVSEEFHKSLAQDTVSNLPGVISVVNQLQTVEEFVAENPDKWIGKKVKLTLLFHRNTNPDNTLVDVKDGIVTLKGEAINSAQQELTSEYARDIEGVKEVKVEMKLAPTLTPTVATPVQKIDDASVTALVKTALLTHRSTSSINTKVQTLNGEVTLTGKAKDESEKALISKVVNDIHGVTEVVNLMTVNEIE